uniref:Uncharacterized protein n=1 Tax=Rhizophora mucronata TaxID=61149 RepID=A0A2P2ITT5_RHIMU
MTLASSARMRIFI